MSQLLDRNNLVLFHGSTLHTHLDLLLDSDSNSDGVNFCSTQKNFVLKRETRCSQLCMDPSLVLCTRCTHYI